MFYTAKELPVFYVLQNSLLSKFKIYTWLYILDKEIPNKNISFDKFIFPPSLLLAAEQAGEAYNKVKIVELWNSGIVNGIVNQILYFFETNLLSFKSAIDICENLRLTIKKIEKSAHLGKRLNERSTDFKLYHNELILLNNNVVVKNNNKRTLIIPYASLKYFITNDQPTCNDIDNFFKEQLKISKLLSNTGLKERIIFFKPIYDKIDKLKGRIELLREFPIY
jgi:hypothetical protein